MDISALFAGSFEALKRRFGLFILIVLLPTLVALVVIGAAVAIGASTAIAAGSGLRGLSAGTLVGIVALVVGALATVLAQVKAQGMMALGAYEVAQGQHPDLRGLLHRTRGFLPRMAGVIAIVAGAVLALYALILGIAMLMVGALDGRSGGRAAAAAGVLIVLVLALIPVAIALQVRLLYTVPAVAIEQRGGLDAMKRSWGLTRGAFWRTLGYYLVMAIAAAAIGYVVSMIGQFALMPAMVGVDRLNDPSRAMAVLMAMLPLYAVVFALQMAVQLLTQPFVHAYTTYNVRRPGTALGDAASARLRGARVSAGARLLRATRPVLRPGGPGISTGTSPAAADVAAAGTSGSTASGSSAELIVGSGGPS